MKKYVSLFAMAAIFATLFMTSCDDDDDDNYTLTVP